MQAVILAAGKSTRTYPLTLTKPKPLLKVANKTILEYNIEAIKDIVEDIIIIVGYKKNMIKKFIQKKYPRLKIKLIEQKQQLGTGHAVSILKRHIKGRFILLMGDNIHSKQDVNKVSKYQYSILVKKVKNPEIFGVIREKGNILIDIIEKPKKFISDLINCALYSFDRGLFDVLKNIKRSERGEYEIIDAIKEISKKKRIHCIKSTSWLDIGYPWDLLTADRKIRKNRNIIGKNSKINGEVKNSTIGNSCIIDGTVTNSIIMDGAIIYKSSIIQNSIIGENVHFNGKVLTKNNVYSVVKGKKIKVYRLGAIIADNVKAENVKINAGCKIWPNRKIKGIIKNDIY